MDPTLQLQTLLAQFDKATKRIAKATTELSEAKAEHAALERQLTSARDEITATLSKVSAGKKAPKTQAKTETPVPTTRSEKQAPRKYSPAVKAEAKRRIEEGKEKTAAIARSLNVTLPAIHLWKAQWGLTKKRPKAKTVSKQRTVKRKKSRP